MAGLDYRSTNKAPEKFFFKGPFFSLLRDKEHLPLRTLGFFNLDDEAKELAVTTGDLHLAPGKYLAWNVWENTAVEFNDTLSAPIPAHGSALFSIVPRNGKIQLLDADLKVADVAETADGLLVSFAFAGKAVITYFDGSAVKTVEFASAAPGDGIILK